MIQLYKVCFFTYYRPLLLPLLLSTPLSLPTYELVVLIRPKSRTYRAFLFLVRDSVFDFKFFFRLSSVCIGSLTACRLLSAECQAKRRQDRPSSTLAASACSYDQGPIAGPRCTRWKSLLYPSSPGAILEPLAPVFAR